MVEEQTIDSEVNRLSIGLSLDSLTPDMLVVVLAALHTMDEVSGKPDPVQTYGALAITSAPLARLMESDIIWASLAMIQFMFDNQAPSAAPDAKTRPILNDTIRARLDHHMEYLAYIAHFNTKKEVWRTYKRMIELTRLQRKRIWAPLPPLNRPQVYPATHHQTYARVDALNPRILDIVRCEDSPYVFARIGDRFFSMSPILNGYNNDTPLQTPGILGFSTLTTNSQCCMIAYPSLEVSRSANIRKPHYTNIVCACYHITSNQGFDVINMHIAICRITGELLQSPGSPVQMDVIQNALVGSESTLTIASGARVIECVRMAGNRERLWMIVLDSEWQGHLMVLRFNETSQRYAFEASKQLDAVDGIHNTYIVPSRCHHDMAFLVGRVGISDLAAVPVPPRRGGRRGRKPIEIVTCRVVSSSIDTDFAGAIKTDAGRPINRIASLVAQNGRITFAFDDVDDGDRILPRVPFMLPMDITTLGLYSASEEELIALTNARKAHDYIDSPFLLFQERPVGKYARGIRTKDYRTFILDTPRPVNNFIEEYPVNVVDIPSTGDARTVDTVLIGFDDDAVILYENGPQLTHNSPPRNNPLRITYYNMNRGVDQVPRQYHRPPIKIEMPSVHQNAAFSPDHAYVSFTPELLNQPQPPTDLPVHCLVCHQGTIYTILRKLDNPTAPTYLFAESVLGEGIKSASSLMGMIPGTPKTVLSSSPSLGLPSKRGLDWRHY